MSLTQVVGADFESLITPHDNSDQLCLLVLQQPQIPGTSLLPLVGIGDESEQLGSHLEDDILVLLVGADVDLFSQLDDGLIVRVVVFFLLRVLCKRRFTNNDDHHRASHSMLRCANAVGKPRGHLDCNCTPEAKETEHQLWRTSSTFPNSAVKPCPSETATKLTWVASAMVIDLVARVMFWSMPFERDH